MWKAAVDKGSTVTTVYYVYDGEGRRVKMRNFGPTGLETVERYIYGATGTLVADYASASAAPTKQYVYGPSGLAATVDGAGTILYLTPDHLGTPRVSMKNQLQVKSRHDYAPFGAELVTGRFGNGYVVDDLVGPRFIGKERDQETGLDYFGSVTKSTEDPRNRVFRLSGDDKCSTRRGRPRRISVIGGAGQNPS